MVARATLMWLAEPSDLQSTSRMPASSRMARAAPPAMTPVPGAAGFSMTWPAPMLPDDRVGDGAAGQRHGEEVLAGLLGALLDGEGHLLGLAVAEADPAGAVADHHERGEREPAAALDDLGDAVDVDDPRVAELGVVVVRGHQNSSPPLRAASARAATRPWYVEPATVEDDGGDAGGLGPLGEELADLAGGRRRCRRCLAATASVVDAAARVTPARSSMTWAAMCLFDRNTARRGRSAVPRTFLRTRRWRRIRDFSLLLCAVSHGVVPCYLPALPALRATCSPRYRTPLPL